MTADTAPSREREALGDGVAPMDSSPHLNVFTVPPAELTVAKLGLPSSFWAKVIRSEPVHASEEGDALMLGVRFRVRPPAMEMTKTSPPVTPSSLIRPSMKATDLPSGEMCGSAICHFGA